MDIRHNPGCDMNVQLDEADEAALGAMQTCESTVVDDGAEIEAKIYRESDIEDPLAFVYGNMVRIYLPQTELRLPVEVELANRDKNTEAMFGEFGKIILSGTSTI